MSTGEYDAVLLALEASFYEVAASFVLWGLHIGLACYAVHLIWKRGLRNSRPRQYMSGIVIFMLSTGTAYVVVMMRFLMIQIPSVMSPETPNTIVRQMRKYTVGFIWLIRLNYCLSDLIVVWRAWALWPNSRLIHWMLGISMIGTVVCTGTNSILMTVETLRPLVPRPTYSVPMSLLLFIPLLATNIFATLLMCYKAWAYWKETEWLKTDSNNRRTYSSIYKSSFRVGRILAFLIETGALYIAFMIFNMAEAFGAFKGTIDGYKFGVVWSALMPEISAIYPTVIIIFVQKLMSQENVVFSEAPYHNKGYPPANGRSDHLERGDGNRALSTIRFDRSRPETVSENEGHNDHTEKERELAIV